MIIIFDLDDTLIDTSGCLIKPKLRDAARAMCREGLPLNAEEAEKMIMDIDKASPHGKETLQRFLEKVGAPPHLLQKGLEAYRTGLGEVKVRPLTGAVEMLKQLHLSHILVLITTGEEKAQYDKLMVAGISPTLFHKIIITADYDKGDKYQIVQDEFAVPPSQMMVCGDKYATDLLPARELGMKTVYVRHGRGLINPPKRGEVDYMINDLTQLPGIVEKVR